MPVITDSLTGLSCRDNESLQCGESGKGEIVNILLTDSLSDLPQHEEKTPLRTLP